MRVEEKFLKILGADGGDVVDGLQLAVRSLQHDAIRFGIGVRESQAPFVASREQRFAFLFDLGGFRRSRLGVAQGSGGGDGDEIGGVVERQRLRRTAGSQASSSTTAATERIRFRRQAVYSIECS